MRQARRWLTLALVLLFPVSWAAPLLRAGLNLPLFGTEEITILSGVVTLWDSDPLLAVLMALFALVAPMAKLIGTLAMEAGLLGARMKPVLVALSRLAMADIFLISLYIIVLKGIMVARVEAGWGLYLFTGCVLASLALSLTARRR